MGFRELKYRIVARAASALLRYEHRLARGLYTAEWKTDDADYTTFDETDAAIADFYARHEVSICPYDYQAQEGEEVVRIQGQGLEPVSIVWRKKAPDQQVAKKG